MNQILTQVMSLPISYATVNCCFDNCSYAMGAEFFAPLSVSTDLFMFSYRWRK